jgi:polar amino acid transport system substrate-binding protein
LDRLRSPSRRKASLCGLVMVLLAVPSLTLAAGKCERLIATGSPDAPPYLWRDPQDPKHLMGANADLLKQAATELGVNVEIVYAGKRSQALEEVRTGRMDLLVDAPLNAAQLDALDFVHPAIARNDILVWTRHDQAMVVDKLADLVGHSGAVSVKTRLTQPFETVVAAQLSLERSPGLVQAFQKLALGQVDYVLAGRYSGMVMSQTLGLSADLVARPVVVDAPGLHLALSFNSACNDAWLRGQLAKKMTESAASGRSDEVIARNLGIWKAQLLQPADASASDK